MTKRSQKTQKSQEFVVVTFTADLEQAKDYETLLKSNDIPAVIKEQNEQQIDTSNIAVMVPEDFLDEAHVVIESQDAYEDFYDSTEDEDNSDFDSDLLDDDF